jgi:hypothetical protein
MGRRGTVVSWNVSLAQVSWAFLWNWINSRKLKGSKLYATKKILSHMSCVFLIRSLSAKWELSVKKEYQSLGLGHVADSWSWSCQPRRCCSASSRRERPQLRYAAVDVLSRKMILGVASMSWKARKPSDSRTRLANTRVYPGSTPQDEVKTYFLLICINFIMGYKGVTGGEWVCE